MDIDNFLLTTSLSPVAHIFFGPSCWETQIVFQQIPTGVEGIEGLLRGIAVYTSQDGVCCFLNAKSCSEEYCPRRDPICAQLMALPWSTTLLFSPAWIFDLTSSFPPMWWWSLTLDPQQWISTVITWHSIPSAKRRADNSENLNVD